jgi:hypothetical protein
MHGIDERKLSLCLHIAGVEDPVERPAAMQSSVQQV